VWEHALRFFKGTRVVLVLRNSEYTVGLGRVHGAVHRPVLDTRVSCGLRIGCQPAGLDGALTERVTDTVTLRSRLTRSWPRPDV
jgi:hypothetical protein